MTPIAPKKPIKWLQVETIIPMTARRISAPPIEKSLINVQTEQRLILNES